MNRILMHGIIFSYAKSAKHLFQTNLINLEIGKKGIHFCLSLTLYSILNLAVHCLFLKYCFNLSENVQSCLG